MNAERKVLGKEKYGDFEVTVYATDGGNVLVYEMQGYIKNDYINQYINDLLAYAQQYQPKAMIADASQIKVLSAEVQQAVQSDFWPKVADMGLSYNPVVMPKSALSSGSVERMIDNSQTVNFANGRKLELATFGSLSDALDWVSSKLVVME